MTWQQYGDEFETHLQTLADRLARGAYRAQPTRRTYIPKADGRQRPLGVTAREDKIVQAALGEVCMTSSTRWTSAVFRTAAALGVARMTRWTHSRWRSNDAR